jgi:hypothetical protein
MCKSDLKKYFLYFIAYLEIIAIIYDDLCHAIDHKKTGGSGSTRTTSKSGDASGRSSGQH